MRVVHEADRPALLDALVLGVPGESESLEPSAAFDAEHPGRDHATFDVLAANPNAADRKPANPHAADPEAADPHALERPAKTGAQTADDQPCDVSAGTDAEPTDRNAR